MAKNALQKIEEHEKLCRIMQKQTHDKINKLERQINRIESILLMFTGALITATEPVKHIHIVFPLNIVPLLSIISLEG